MKTIGIIGSRRRTGVATIKAITDAFNDVYTDGDRIVSGGCPVGGDAIAERIAKQQEVPITIHYARWKKHGKSAGFQRNTDIAKDADYIIATVSEDRTGGTEDTIKKWLKMRDLTEARAIAAGLLKLV